MIAVSADGTAVIIEPAEADEMMTASAAWTITAGEVSDVGN